MEYDKTRNILHIMNLLGHRNIESTLVYTHLISSEGDEYHSAVAKTVEKARKLLEEGFEYVCQKDDLMLFRKKGSSLITKTLCKLTSHIVNSHLHHESFECLSGGQIKHSTFASGFNALAKFPR